MKTTSERIKEALEIRQMKQTDLVEKTGIGKSSISTYISGAYEPKQRNIYKIAKALDVSESWLMGYDVPMERIPIEIKESQSTPPISLNEQRLLKSFSKLNSIGQDKVIEYSEDLLSNYRYTVETIAAHNDFADEPGEQERMRKDLDKL